MVEGLSYSEMEASVRGYIQRFGLNPGQASVLLHIASWLTPPHSEPRKETTMSERTEVPGDGILSKDACSLQPPEGRNAKNHAASLGEAERTRDGDHTI
jgi:hypothetical protein